jgi:hypothetical protein
VTKKAPPAKHFPYSKMEQENQHSLNEKIKIKIKNNMRRPSLCREVRRISRRKKKNLAPGYWFCCRCGRSGTHSTITMSISVYTPNNVDTPIYRDASSNVEGAIAQSVLPGRNLITGINLARKSDIALDHFLPWSKVR